MPKEQRRDPRTLLAVGLWGGITTVVAYLLSFGSILLFIALMIVFGVALRLAAFIVTKRVRIQRPRGRWL